MDTNEILEIAFMILAIAAYALMLYFRVRGDVVEAVSEFIAMAEATGMTGKEKMALVVSKMYQIVPVPLKKILSEERLEVIAQSIFDWMRKYADTYKKSKEETEDPQKAKSDAEQALLTDMISTLLGMTVSELKDKAAEYGIEIDTEKTRLEITRRIVQELLKRS